MKKIFCICFCIYTALQLTAFDISFDGTAGSFGIKEELNRTQAGAPAAFFDSHTFNLSLQDEIASNILATGICSRDNIMLNSIAAIGSLQLSNINFSIGPYFTIGATNDDDLTNGKFFDSNNLFLPGILLGTEVGSPGHITGFFTLKTSLSQKSSDTNMAFKMYTLGMRLWVPNVICEARFDQKKSEKTLSGVDVTSSQTDAGIYFDIFQKALPFRFAVKGLWRNVSKAYTAGRTANNTYLFIGTIDTSSNITGTMTPNTVTMQGEPGTDSINYIIVGASITFITGPLFQWYAGAECSVFAWHPKDDNQHLTGSPETSMPAMSVAFGLKYRFNNKEAARGYKPAEKKAVMKEEPAAGSTAVAAPAE